MDISGFNNLKSSPSQFSLTPNNLRKSLTNKTLKSETKEKTEKLIYNSAKSFDYENLLAHLRALRVREQRKKEEEAQRKKENEKTEARSMFRLFEKQYIPGKGMQSAGYGDVMIGKHYDMKK